MAMTVTLISTGAPRVTRYSCFIFFLVVHSICSVQTLSLEDYITSREDVVREEANLTIGSDLFLSNEEIKANKILMTEKYKEVNDGFNDPGNFTPANHFFTRKSQILNSNVFNIIRKMPKGAALHVHDSAMIGNEYIIPNITYRENLYMRGNTPEDTQFKFSLYAPDSDWQLLSDIRKYHQNVTQFDEDLAKLFTLEVSDPRTEYPNINVVWKSFENIFVRLFPMLTYKPVWEDYIYEALTRYMEDNLLYVEIRTTLPELYDLDGRIYSKTDCAHTYKNITDRFKVNHPRWFGARIIYAPVRKVDLIDIREYITTLKIIKNELGNFIAGFDLVGQEDMGKPLIDFIPELLKIPDDINVFYHAAETNWFGTDTDFNIIDAILLNATRLGHAYGLLKHPVIANIVKEKQIAVEINPLSNQILMLVEDLRNHPASIMFAEKFPIVISSDDPGLWGALPMSHDMYEAFIGIASRNSDIRLLKQLAINSIKFSAMENAEKQTAMEMFNKQWNIFIDNIINQ